MIKTIPFDIDLARNGAKVCLEDGTPVEIVNFNLDLIAAPSYPILGLYKNLADEDHYEVWPRSGSYADELGRAAKPQDLRIVDETPEPGYTVQGDAIVKDGRALYCLFLNPDSGATKAEHLKKIADALNFWDKENSIAGRCLKILKETQDHAQDAIKYAIHNSKNPRPWGKEILEARIKDLEHTIDLLKARLKAANDINDSRRKHYKELEDELAVYRDQVKAPISVATMADLTRQVVDLEQWKRESIEVWGPVFDYMHENPGDLTVGDSIGKEVLKRVIDYEDLIRWKERMLKALVKWREVKTEINEIGKQENI